MGIVTFFARFFLKSREKYISNFIKNTSEDQKQIFDSLINKGRNTYYGEKYKFDFIKSYEDFSSKVPVVDYEDFFIHIK